MMPDNTLSSVVQHDRYIHPYGLATTLLTDAELGGIALSDPTQGLEYQTWHGEWKASDSTVYLRPLISGGEFPIWVEPGVLEFSFTFDQNMRPQLALLLSGGVLKFRWYDAAIQGYTITTYTGVTAFKVRLDDKRRQQLYLDTTDVILTYVREGALYFRMQRDRYGTEYLLQSDVSDKLVLTNFGMTRLWRMQWRFEYRTTMLE